MRALFASDPAACRGRLYPEAPSEHRSEFQRDRDRIIHATAFRRLKHKTQVDLGHTPFGHTGEDALHDVMAPFGGFDHNAQAVKIVTALEQHYAEFDGLNLAWETLEGIAKHNGPVTGALPFALAAYNERHDLELHTHASAEAQVAAVSDDIAYNNHDLMDGLRAGLFPMAEAEALPLVRDATRAVDARYPDTDPRRRRYEILRRVFGVMVEDVMTESRRLLAASQATSAADIRHLGRPVVRFSDAMWADLKQIRAFLFQNMYRHSTVSEMRVMSDRVVRELFDIFMDAPALLPDGWQSQVQTGDVQHRARTIADYIAGMTDRFALTEHRRLCGGAE